MLERIISTLKLSVFAIAYVFSFQSHAEQHSETQSEELTVCEHNCVEDTELIIKFTAGEFRYESPLSVKDDLNYSFLPTWTFYYKDIFYIENTKVGLNLWANEHTVIDLVSKHNFDGLYYHGDDQISNFVNPFLPPFEWPSKNAHLSYLAGIEVKHFYQKNIVSLGVYSDVSNVHHGEEAEISWQRVLLDDQFKLAIEIGAIYKSDQLLNYYYGSPLHGDNVNYYYQIDAAYPLTEYLSLVFNYKYERLSSKIDSSQATNKDELESGFLGISWITNW